MSAIQPSLFESQPFQQSRARARRHDPPTSKAAAKLFPATEFEALVLDALRSHPRGLTSHEAATILDRDLVSVSPRFRPMAEKNLIIATAETKEGTERAEVDRMEGPLASGGAVKGQEMENKIREIRRRLRCRPAGETARRPIAGDLSLGARRQKPTPRQGTGDSVSRRAPRREAVGG